MERREIATPAGPMAVLCWDRAGPRAPWLHFAHATGMNAALYARLLEPLADSFRIIASDARGHGRTRLPADPEALGGWEDFAADLTGLIDVIDADARWLLAGHSMGGTCSLLASARSPQRVAGLVLLDPPFIPFAEARAFAAEGGRPPNPMADQAGRRKPGFPSRAMAREAYRGRGVFATWADEDLDAYLADGLIDTDDGVILACAPAFESATFRAVSLRVEPALQALRVPFALLAAEHGSTVRTAELAHFAEHPACLEAQRLPGTSHFLPLEAGDAVRAAIGRVATAEPLSSS
jgi:pimeloyl-ACP methyl ester carboxylesterase